MTAPSINMLAPNAVVGETFVAKSGNSYISDAFGVLKSVTAPDAVDFFGQGAIPLGQAGALSNLNATTNPGVGNDNTQDYAIGSRWLNKTTTVEYVATSVATGAANWVALNAAGLPGLPWVTGQFYSVPDGVTPVSFLTVLGTMYAYPIFIPNKVTLASLSISSLTGQTGGLVRAALYADTGAGYPGALIAGTDSGSLAATTTAVATKSSLAVVINPGWYWVATQATASSTMPSVAAITNSYANGMANTLGFDTAAHSLAAGSEAPTGLAVTGQTYGAMPSTFPAGAALVLNASSIPLVALGV